MKKITLIIALLCTAMVTNAQVLLDEGFVGGTFPDPQLTGQTLNDATNGWTVVNGAWTTTFTCHRTTTAGGLTYPATGTKYVNSGTSNTLVNAYSSTDGGSVATKSFNASTIKSGSVYLSFLYNGTATGTQAQVLGLASTSVGNPVSVMAGSMNSGANYKLGLSRGSTSSANYVWNNSTLLNYGTTYLIVLKYTLAGNVATLYVNPVIGGTESAETPWAIDNTSPTIIADVQYIMQRGSGGNRSSYSASGLRVSTTWAAAVAAATSANTKIDAPTTITSAASITSSGFTAAWSTVAAANGYQVNVYDASNNLIAAPVASGQSTSSLAVTGLSGNTTYTYKVIALTNTPNTLANSAESVASTSFTTSTGSPVMGANTTGFAIATPGVGNVTPVSASCTSIVADWGGANVTTRGLCWSTSTGPTTGGSKTSETISSGKGTGLFNHSLYGLTPNTKYYVRAYATNSNGTTYSAEDTVHTLNKTCYYSQGNLDAKLTTSWKTTRDASGTNPSNLTTAAYYVVQNGHSLTTSAAFSFGAGATSALLIENGGTLTGTFAITMAASTIFQIDNGGSFVQNWGAAMSTTIFQGAEVFAPASNYSILIVPSGTTAPAPPGYGNLTINTPANAASLGLSNNVGQVQGNLNFFATGTSISLSYRFMAGTSSTISIGGNLTVSGSSAFLAFTSGAGVPLVNVGGDVTISSGGKLDFATSSSGAAGTLNIGGNFNSSGTFLSTTTTSPLATVNFLGFGKTFTQSGTYTSTNINYSVAKGASLTLVNDLNLAASRTLTVDGLLATGVTLNNAGAATINGTLQINQGGYAATSGAGAYTWAATGSTLVYNNTSGVYGSIATHPYWVTGASNQPYNVSLTGAGGVDMGSSAHTIGGVVALSSGLTNCGSLTVNGTLQLNTGGYVGNAPIYGSSSTLIYNTGATFGRGSELNTSTPSNIQVSNKTVLNYPNGANVARTITGNLTVDAGSALYMDYGSIGMTNPLTVGGNVSLNGNVSLGDGVGGDLVVAGNWSKGPSCTFAPNSRAVKFNHASAIQTITGGGTFAYLTLDKAAGSLTLVDSAVVVNNTLFMTNGKLVLGGANLTSGSISGASATSYIVTNGAGDLIQSVGAATATLFPIGASTSSYDPATVTPTSTTTIAASVSGTLAYHNLSVPGSVYLNPREWTIASSTPSSTVLALTPSALGLSGLYNAMSGGSQGYDGINNNYYFSSASRSGNTFTATYSDFTNPFITATTDILVAVKEITAKSGIYAANGQIFVENAAGKVINVYSLAGSKVRCLKNSTEKAIIPIEKGIYIISVDNVKSKVLVR
jgi:hypothetical protein